MESAERISKALENTAESMESARATAKFAEHVIAQMEGVMKTTTLNAELKGEPDSGKDEVALMTLLIETAKLQLEKTEQRIESMREIQKILFSTRNKRIEEAIKYIEQVCDKYDNNFYNYLRSIQPKYMQWLVQTEFFKEQLTKLQPGDNIFGYTPKQLETAVDVTTELIPMKSIDDTFKILALVFHPDKGGDTERFKIINNAYDHLQHVDIESNMFFEIFRICFCYVIYSCYDVNQFSDIQKILAEKS